MSDFSRPDTTTEGWHTWPTERVSHALVADSESRNLLEARAMRELAAAPEDVAALRLAPEIRILTENLVKDGKAEELRESLVTFALSRVDWLQLAQAVVEATVPEELETRGTGALAA